MSTITGSVTDVGRETPRNVGVVTGAPQIILRLEGACVLAFAVMAYARTGGGWGMFALLFLTPDLSMLGYLVDRKVGAALYNLGHSYLLPAGLTLFGLAASTSLAISLALVWVAHIGFDRVLGYGLKYSSAFKHTHLGQGVSGTTKG